jgi:hypothetical protein
LTLVDLGTNPQKILDLGTGVGTWAVDGKNAEWSVAKLTMFSGRSISHGRGRRSRLEPDPVDLGAAKLVSRQSLEGGNADGSRKFILDDFEDEWALGSDWDLVHCRHCLPVIKGVERVLQMSFE